MLKVKKTPICQPYISCTFNHSNQLWLNELRDNLEAA